MFGKDSPKHTKCHIVEGDYLIRLLQIAVLKLSHLKLTSLYGRLQTVRLSQTLYHIQRNHISCFLFAGFTKFEAFWKFGYHGRKHIQEKLLDQARNQWSSIVSMELTY